MILQRPVERAQMRKLLATGKTDLLQFVSARTKRGFSAFLVRQPDGKIGFEFEAQGRDQGRGARARRRRPALRVLGAHPKDGKPVELHAGRYGPYVKHGDVNATLPDRDKVDSLTLPEAVVLLDEKAAKQGVRRPAQGANARRRRRPRPSRVPLTAPRSRPASRRRQSRRAKVSARRRRRSSARQQSRPKLSQRPNRNPPQSRAAFQPSSGARRAIGEG